jgi:hypothetical protein
MLTPLKMFCENMLTHVPMVIHLVVGTFDQGWRSWWSWKAHWSWPDARPVHPISGREVARSRSIDWTLEVKEDLTHGEHCSHVRSVLTWRLLVRGVERVRDWMLTALGYRRPDALGHDFSSLDCLWKWPNSRRWSVWSSGSTSGQ